MARIEKTIDVEVPVRTVYNQCTQFKDFPRFMEGVEQVEQLDDTHLRVHATVAGQEKVGDVSITEQVPERIIAWRGPNGASGQVSFRPTHTAGTRLALEIEYEPEGFLENVGEALGMTSRRVESDLQRFKAFIEERGMETGRWQGEVRQGQPSDGSGGEPESVVSVGTADSVGVGAGSPDSGAYDPLAGQSGETSEPAGSSGSAVGDSADQWSAERSAERERRRPVSRPPSSGTGATRSGRRWLPSSLHMWDDPFETMRRMSDEMDRIFATLTGSRGLAARGGAGETAIWRPQVEVSQEGGELVICADLPGIKKEDVQIEFAEGILTIEGERRQEREASEQDAYRRTERRYGRFYRAIPLPEGIDADAARATMRDGVIEIRVPAPKLAQARRRIEIQGAEEQPHEHGRRAA